MKNADSDWGIFESQRMGPRYDITYFTFGIDSLVMSEALSKAEFGPQGLARMQMKVPLSLVECR